MSVLKLMRLLHLVGVAFAIVGAVGADDLFDATTVSTFERGQKLRKISARVSLQPHIMPYHGVHFANYCYGCIRPALEDQDRGHDSDARPGPKPSIPNIA